MSLLSQHRVEVACVGELVVLMVGARKYSIEFHLALQISAALRHEAKFAKMSAGFGEWARRRTVGVLHDAAAPKPKRKRFMEKLPELLKLRDISVCASGQMVNLRFGSVTMSLPWSTALEIAQWLRVRGKEAKRNAGEGAHWSTFGSDRLIVPTSRAMQ